MKSEPVITSSSRRPDGKGGPSAPIFGKWWPRVNRQALLPVVALTVAFGGFFAAAVLSLGHFLKLPVPCGASPGCIAVAMHPASKVFGIPIAYFGAAAYIAIIALFRAAPAALWGRIASVALTGIGTATSAFLLYYSQTVIRATCPWCVASGVAMGLLLVLSFLLLRRGASLQAIRPAVFWGLAIFTSGALGIQAGLMERAASKPPVSAERLRNLRSEELIDPAKSLGPADAPVTIIMFGDLWCPGCRAFHKPLVEYQMKHAAGVRLVYRHLPLYRIRGHQFSGTAAALSEIAAENGQFWPFVELVYRQRGPLSGEAYRHLLNQLGVDASQVTTRLNNPNEPAYARVLRDMDFADELGIHQTPTFILLVAGQQPISANQRTLPRILNSPGVQSRLAESRPLEPNPDLLNR